MLYRRGGGFVRTPCIMPYIDSAATEQNLTLRCVRVWLSAGRVPTVRLLVHTDELRQEEGARLELRCRSRGARPPARIVWTRNAAVLVDRVNRARITTSR